MAGRKCSLCTKLSPGELGELERRVIAGEPLRAIASQYAPISHHAIIRHRDNCMRPEQIQQAQASRELAHTARNEDLLSFLLGLRAHAVRLFRKAEADNDLRCASVILREIRELVAEQARLRIASGRGELDAKTIDVLELTDEELIRIAGNAPARMIGRRY